MNGRLKFLTDRVTQAAVYATQARGPGTLRAYRSAWRQYDAWCTRLGLSALSADPRLVGMYLTAAAERLAVALLASSNYGFGQLKQGLLPG